MIKYAGGKAAVAPALGAWLSAQAAGAPGYWEPFIGAGWVMVEVGHPRRRGSDAYREMIALLRALRDGWRPPRAISDAGYVKAWANAQSGSEGPLETFAAHACAFGGDRFVGYARGGGRNYAREAARSCEKRAPRLAGVELEAHGFDAWAPPEPGWLVYCDPPYADTTRPGRGAAFPFRRFWAWAAEMARAGHRVRVSEYRAPRGWRPVWSRSRAMGLAKGGRKPRVTEHVFQLEGCP